MKLKDIVLKIREKHFSMGAIEAANRFWDAQSQWLIGNQIWDKSNKHISYGYGFENPWASKYIEYN